MAIHRILQFSDIHICDEGDGHQGFPVRENFKNSLKQGLKEVQPDLVIISGDLAEDEGEIGAYRWIKKELETLEVPCLLMSGNHDITTIMAKEMDLELSLSNKLVGTYEIGNFNIIYLDSSEDFVSKDQLEWMKNQVKHSSKEPLIFVHHPPTLADCRFMDTLYPMKNHEEFWECVKSTKKVKHIFCGHYHTDKTFEKDGIMVYICPSTLFQIATNTKGFRIADKQPAYFEITLEGSQISTKTHYLKDQT